MTIKNRQQWLGLAAGAVVALLAADRLILTPLSHSWTERAARVQTLRKQVTDGNNLLRWEKDLRGRWDLLRNNTLPNDNSQAEQRLLNGFDRWARDSRTTVVSVSPQWKHDADDYMTLECRVEASGNLSAVTRFLYNLERDPMALKLQAFELAAHDNDGQQFSLALQVSGLVLTPTQARGGGR